jgi:spoIIIJ-associated protein
MLSQDYLETIKKTVAEFLAKMTFEAEVEVFAAEERTLLVNIKTEEPQILIGERGETLAEIQHLLKLILRKKVAAPQELFYIDLDINDYKKKKIDYLKEMAKSAAEEVALTKKEKILEPMSSYERRIVHMELAQRTDVISESIGQEPERRIVIRPKF